MVYDEIRGTKRFLYERHPKDSEFRNSEYEVHQFGSKYSGSQNSSFLALKGKAVGVVQIFAYGNGGNGA